MRVYWFPRRPKGRFPRYHSASHLFPSGVRNARRHRDQARRPAHRLHASGRLVDARYLLSRWAWVRKSPRPRPWEGTTASRRRMLTAPTPLFFAAICSAILGQDRSAIYTADCASLWRTITWKTPYCRAKAASFVPTEPMEMNHAQVVMSKRSAIKRLANPRATSKAAQP